MLCSHLHEYTAGKNDTAENYKGGNVVSDNQKLALSVLSAGFGHQANSREPRGFLDDGGSMEFLTDLPNLSCMLEDMPSGGEDMEAIPRASC